MCPLLPIPPPPPAQAQVSVQDLPDGCTSSPAFRSHSWFGPWVDVPIEDVKAGVRQPEVEVRCAFAHCITEWSVFTGSPIQRIMDVDGVICATTQKGNTDAARCVCAASGLGSILCIFASHEHRVLVEVHGHLFVVELG
jgi:hypothetical protein